MIALKRSAFSLLEMMCALAIAMLLLLALYLTLSTQFADQQSGREILAEGEVARSILTAHHQRHRQSTRRRRSASFSQLRRLDHCEQLQHRDGNGHDAGARDRHRADGDLQPRRTRRCDQPDHLGLSVQKPALTASGGGRDNRHYQRPTSVSPVARLRCGQPVGLARTK